MKKSTSHLLIIILISFIAFPLQAQDIQEEFQGIKWGTNIKSLAGFDELYSKNEVIYYINPQKTYEISGYRLTDVTYGSYQGAFFAVFMNIEKPEIFAEIKSYLKNKFGFPQRTFSAKNDQTEDSWQENEIKIKLKYNERSEETKLAFYYMPISNNINEEEQEDEFSKKGIRILPREKRETYESYPLLVF